MVKIYVSSTMIDLEAERQAVIDWLIAAGHQPVHSFTADSETVRTSCTDDVAHCDVYVLILGHRYGHQPEDDNPEGLSITHLEFRRAGAEDIPVIALFRTTIPDVRLSDIQDPPRMGVLENFHREVRSAVRHAEFRDLAELKHHLSIGVQRELDKQQKRPRLAVTDLRERFRRASRDLLSWPTTLPSDRWLERPEFDTLLQRIESELHSVRMLLGEPGCGKSALLARLGSRLEQRSVPVLGIKADYLPENLEDEAALGTHLGLPDTPVACVRVLAKEGPVVVLIDQLDALADLVVQHSERLRVPLELIRDLVGMENVHVVASCRPFEHRHDPRLRNLDVDTLELALPPWEEVDTVLRQYGVYASSWNEDVRGVLCSPHALDIFLSRLRSTDEAHLLNGYHGVLQALWDQTVASDASGQRRELLRDMAQQMADREVFWLPAVPLEPRRNTLNTLLAGGFLTTDSSGARIGFRHQTLYEFVRARSFLEVEGSLSETVIARQDSLRIRPQLWHALGYLRNADWWVYIAEINRLWDSPELRRHLRMLLIEFLGQLREPKPEELRLFVQRLENPWYRNRILSAVVGSPGWFEHLAQGPLPAMMTQPRQEAETVFPLLAVAMAFAPDTVLRLVDDCWLPQPEMDSLSWQLIQETREWTSTQVDRLCRILARSRAEAWRVDRAASLVSADLPDEAPRLLGLWLEYEWRHGAVSTLVSGAASGENDFEPTDASSAKRAHALLENQELQNVQAVAEVAPSAFLRAVWARFLKLLAEATPNDHAVLIRYRRHPQLSDALGQSGEDLAHRDRPLLSAVAAAVTGLARLHPEDFLKFACENEHLDLLLVQRLLAMGMTQIAGSHAVPALAFLCADPRRLLLGPFDDVYRDTRDLVQALAPRLSLHAFAQLEQHIINWNRSKEFRDEDASVRRERLRWGREDRLHLLQALPGNRMSPSCQRLIAEEMRAFPHHRESDARFPRLQEIGSPVNARQMGAAHDEDIVHLFEELTDDYAWNHPRHSMMGGPIQAGRELSRLAEADPERAVRLARRLVPGKNEIPVSLLIDALAKTRYDRLDIYSLIQELTDKGFGSPTFQHSVARAIESIVEPAHPIPDHLLATLERWLMPSTDSHDDEQVLQDPDGATTRSVLWGTHGARFLPGGNYPVLAALSAACLKTRPGQTDRWLDILENHLRRAESPKVWSALAAPYLTWLHLADRNRAQCFLDRLWQIQPALHSTLEGLLLLGTCQHWVHSDYISRWLEDLALVSEPVAAQGCGELLMYRRALFPDEPWVADRIAAFLRNDQRNATKDLIRVGVAHAVAYLLSVPLHRRVAHGYLLHLLRADDPAVHQALGRIFREGYLPADQFTAELLDALCADPRILQSPDAEFLPEALTHLVSLEPQRVYRVCETLLDQVGEQLESHATSWPLRSEALVSIALALQDLGGGHRHDGTALFERLLELNLPYARDTLTDLDKRTSNSGSVASRPLRRRGRSRRKMGAE